MPLYTHECPCGHVTTYLRHYAQRHEAATCCACGTATHPAAVESFAIGGPRETPLRSGAPRFIGFLAERSQIEMRDCSFGGCDVGIVADDSHIDAKNATFVSNKKNIEAKDSVVRLRNTKST